MQQLEKTGRPFRIAIDIAIWQFQTQSGQGGKNPALRILYYRLLKLLALAIQPLFIFDGPERPTFKRGVKIAPNVNCLDNLLTKRLLDDFGFPYHDAPGEAEAECALLQKEGVVDAVMSEDVDTLMFGCNFSLRNWTAEGARGNKSPTHVDVYRSARTKETSGLDSEGMILVALMSGGDYMQAGIPGCGIKTACEAARAGFGRDLCRLARHDDSGLQLWRDRLQYELKTNESGHFQRKHGTVVIPVAFPDKTILGYYTHPVVSTVEKVRRLRRTIKWTQDVNVPNLRSFVAEKFNWSYVAGAQHFIRGLAPALLVHRLIKRGQNEITDRESINTKSIAESSFIKTISGRRINWITDGEPELRIAYVPAEIVDVGYEAEETRDISNEGRDNDQEETNGSDSEALNRSRSPTKRPSAYDPSQVEKIWVLETYIKLGVPLLVETYEEDMRNTKNFASRKARERTVLATCGMREGAIEKYAKFSKPGINKNKVSVLEKSQPALTPPVYLAPATNEVTESLHRESLAENRRAPGKVTHVKGIRKTAGMEGHSESPRPNKSAARNPASSQMNPWTLAKKSFDTAMAPLPFQASPSDCVAISRASPSRRAESVSPTSKTQLSMGITPRSKARAHRSDDSASTENSDGARESSPNVRAHNGSNPIPKIPKRHGPSKLSARKKRSSLQLADDIHPTAQLRTPESVTRCTDEPLADNANTKHAQDATNPRKVNRKLDFGTPCLSSSQSPFASDSDSLPSPSALLSPPSSAQKQTHKLAMGHPESRLGIVSRERRIIAVRESLEGAWKHVDVQEVKWHASRNVYSRVEVIDLTTA